MHPIQKKQLFLQNLFLWFMTSSTYDITVWHRHSLSTKDYLESGLTHLHQPEKNLEAFRSVEFLHL